MRAALPVSCCAVVAAINPHHQLRIRGQMSVPTAGPSPCLPVGMDNERETFDRDFENVFDEDMTGGSAEPVNAVTGQTDYFCIFCDERGFSGRDDARRHYQRHLDYFPILCSLCGQRTADLTDFLKHHTSCHPGVEKGKYKRRPVAHWDRWLSGFLYAQATIVSAFPPRDNCPVCDKVFTRQEVTGAAVRRHATDRHVDHVHRHLCYLPFECTACRQQGRKEFLVAYLDSKAQSHIHLMHPELSDPLSPRSLFHKSFSIPELDKFVVHYLQKCGMSPESHDGDSVPLTDGQQSLCSEEIVVHVSPEMLDIDFMDEDPFFCIFCPEKIATSAEARLHFAGHFNYHPIICLICSQRFNDIETFSFHHMSSHETESDLSFEVREDFMIEKWIDDFLKYQRSSDINEMRLRCSCGKFCPSCCKVSAKANTAVTCLAHDELFFSDHLKQHLNYVPFVCLICERSGKEVRVTNLSSSGASHVHEEHSDLSPETLSRTGKLFSKVLFAQMIEDVIRSNCITRQALFADTTFHPVSENRRLVQSAKAGVVDTTGRYPRSNQIDGMANIRVITEGNRMVLKQFRTKGPKILSKSIPQPKPVSNHIRIEGGRVINLPDARPHVHKDIPSSHFRIGIVSRSQGTMRAIAGSLSKDRLTIGRMGDEGMVNQRIRESQSQKRNHVQSQASLPSSARVAVPVMCLHCNRLFPSKRLLRLHSNKYHPGLQVTFATSSTESQPQF